MKQSTENIVTGTSFYMKTSLRILVILLVSTSLVACSSLFDHSSVSVKKLIWLERDGIFDPEVPNTEVHALLTKGLYHRDPKIVACSISVIFWYVAISDTAAIMRKPRPIDRQLADIPGIYDLFIGLWDEGWTKSGGTPPDLQPSPEIFGDRLVNKTDCILTDREPVWVSLMSPLVYIFPGDERVHEIVWKTMPQVNPDGLLSVLHEGKFDTPNSQQHRIDILTNPETEEISATLAAESLGVFRSEDGLEALVTVLETGIPVYVPIKMTIVDSMIKYEEDAVPYIALMQQTLDSARTDDEEEIERKEDVQWRLKWFERDYAEEIDGPSD